MKKYLLVAQLLVLCLATNAQVAGIDTIQYKGDINKFGNIILVGDGYTAAQQTKFIADVTAIKNTMFNTAPWQQYINYFNVFAISVISADSGAKHPNTASDCSTANPPVPVANPNTYLGVSFDIGGIHRLLYPTNNTNLTTILSSTFPAYDLCIVVANTPYYGGGGGQVATISLDASATEIALHEVGHAFAGLADEYWAGASYAIEKPNMTQQSSPSLIKWKNWLNAPTTIGIYPFTEDTTWYRPYQSCRMRYLGYPYCSVCTEAIVEQIHNIVNPVLSYLPANAAAINSSSTPLTFKLTEVKPVPNTLKTYWKLNGAAIGGNTDTMVISPSALTAATDTLVASVIDTTSLTRSDVHFATHIFTTTWIISKNTAGIQIAGKQNDFMVSVFPNPATDQLNVSIKSATTGKAFEISIVSIDGKLIRSTSTQQAANNQANATLQTADLAPGNYMLLIKNDAVNYSTLFTRQ